MWLFYKRNKFGLWIFKTYFCKIYIEISIKYILRYLSFVQTLLIDCYFNRNAYCNCKYYWVTIGTTLIILVNMTDKGLLPFSCRINKLTFSFVKNKCNLAWDFASRCKVCFSLTLSYVKKSFINFKLILRLESCTSISI